MHIHAAALLRDEPGSLERLQVMADCRFREPNGRCQVAGAGFLIRLIQHVGNKSQACGVSEGLQSNRESNGVTQGKVWGRRQRRTADGRDIVQNGESFGHAHSMTVISYISNKRQETP